MPHKGYSKIGKRIEIKEVVDELLNAGCCCSCISKFLFVVYGFKVSQQTLARYRVKLKEAEEEIATAYSHS